MVAVVASDDNIELVDHLYKHNKEEISHLDLLQVVFENGKMYNKITFKNIKERLKCYNKENT